ncbi:MAG: tetratricopeptide repeat protein [Candidatus Omnitrophica bacterium]|nr:tetratricopeptide repeat protein [Candidatus Omnitrophota bacterium]
MSSRLVIIILGLFTFLGVAGSAYFFMEKKSLNDQLVQSRNTIQVLQKNIAVLEEDKSSLAKEKDKLQMDSVFYVEMNTKVQQEKEKIQKGLEDAQKIIETKEAELERLNLSLKRIQEQASKEISKEKETLEKQRKELAAKISSLTATLKKERALFNYNLGVAYTQAKFYEDALEAYGKALKVDPGMAEAHYNLALLYESVEQDYELAIQHYSKYLELAKDSSDREEAKEAIARLNKKILME